MDENDYFRERGWSKQRVYNYRERGLPLREHKKVGASNAPQLRGGVNLAALPCLVGPKGFSHAVADSLGISVDALIGGSHAVKESPSSYVPVLGLDDQARAFLSDWKQLAPAVRVQFQTLVEVIVAQQHKAERAAKRKAKGKARGEDRPSQ